MDDFFSTSPAGQKQSFRYSKGYFVVASVGVYFYDRYIRIVSIPNDKEYKALSNELHMGNMQTENWQLGNYR